MIVGLRFFHPRHGRRSASNQSAEQAPVLTHRLTFTFTLHLHLGHLADTFIHSDLQIVLSLKFILYFFHIMPICLHALLLYAYLLLDGVYTVF